MEQLRTQIRVRRYSLSSGGILLLSLLLTRIPTEFRQPEIALLYLLLILIIATTLGRGPAIVASLLAFLTANFFFIAPRYTFSISDPWDVVRLTTFLAVAVSTSGLAGRVRQQATLAQERTHELTTLYSLSQKISAEVDLGRILPMIAETTSALLRVPCSRILLYDAYGIKVLHAVYGNAPTLSRTIDTVLQAGKRAIGSLQVLQQSSDPPLTAAEQDRLTLIANQIVLVVERARLVQEAGMARTLAESDRLKSVLLTSVSHDLRTPLALIKGAVTNLLDEGVAWDKATHRELLLTVNQETDHLNRLVGNLLEMSRIETNALAHTRTWQDAGELIEIVVARLRPVLANHPLHVLTEPDLPLVSINAIQIDLVLTNLLENAAVHTPPYTPISVSTTRAAEGIHIVVQDAGPGIPAGMTQRIFDRFVRATDAERPAGGSGLGLAIVKGLVEAHNGHVWVSNLPGGGAAFTILLPIKTKGPE